MTRIPPEAVRDDAEDLRLVAAIRAGDTGAWNILLTRYQHRLFTVCFRMVHDRELAADLTQDSFVKAVQKFSTFDSRAKLSTWLIKITMNTCLSALRSEKLRRHASLDAKGGETDRAPGTRPGADREPSAAESVELIEERRALSEALATLDDQQRSILLLRDGRDLDYDQIAEVLDLPVGTVKSHLFRARVALREALENKLGRSVPSQNHDAVPVTRPPAQPTRTPHR
jgi:RNA polymerase sigma-70 factor (ECF subfamily)